MRYLLFIMWLQETHQDLFLFPVLHVMFLLFWYLILFPVLSTKLSLLEPIYIMVIYDLVEQQIMDYGFTWDGQVFTI